MSTQVQYRRGSNVQVAAFTGALGEMVIDTTNKIVVVQDGATVGGFAQVGATATQTITNKIYQGTSLSVSGNVTGNYLLGNAYFVTGLSPTSIYSGTSNVNVTSSGGNVSVGVGGTPNVVVWATSGEYVTGLQSVTGNITGGNILSNGRLSVVGNLVQSGANSFTAWSYGSSLVAAGSTQGTAYVITATNNQFNNVGSGTGAILPAGLPGQVVFVANDGANALTIYPPSGGSIDQAATNAGVTVTAGGMWMGTALGSNVWTTISPDTVATTNQTTVTQGNGIVTIGLASSPSVSGTVTLAGIINAGANGVGNIGTSTGYFNTVFAKATSAQYADLAEMYCADSAYAPGTVIEFGGAAEVTATTESHSTRVAGIVSTNPSYLMNSTIECENAVAVALTGRVPCRVVGVINKGDRLVASGLYAGVATSLDMSQYQPGCIIGKSLEDYDSTEVGTIEVAVGRT
jgi:hypothetical protein